MRTSRLVILFAAACCTLLAIAPVHQAAISSSATNFSDPILSFDPYFFAASYHRFKGSPNGCVHLTALLDGEAGFIAMLMTDPPSDGPALSRSTGECRL